MIYPIHLLGLVAVMAGLLPYPVTAASILTITLDSPSLSGPPNTVVSFTGKITNSGHAEVFLNGAGGGINSMNLILDTSPFFGAAPFSLAAGEFYQGPVFDVFISAFAATGTYTGSFVIQGGPDSAALDDVGSIDFEVSAVPEPGTFTLAVIATACALGMRPRRGQPPN